MLFKMIKFKLLFAIFFLLAFQVAYCSSNFHLGNASGGRGVESKNQCLIEADRMYTNLVGDWTLGLAQSSVLVSGRECFFSISKTKS